MIGADPTAEMWKRTYPALGQKLKDTLPYTGSSHHPLQRVILKISGGVCFDITVDCLCLIVFCNYCNVSDCGIQ